MTMDVLLNQINDFKSIHRGKDVRFLSVSHDILYDLGILAKAVLFNIDFLGS